MADDLEGWLTVRRPRTSLRWLVDPLTIVGTALSVGLGVLFYLRTDVPAALGVLAGLQGTLLVMQIQLLLRQERQQEVQARQERLMRHIEQVPWLVEPIEQLAQVALTIEQRYGSTMVRVVAQDVLDGLLNTLRDLERGHYLPGLGATDMPITLTHGTTETLLATSVEKDGYEWWFQRQGREYWQANIEARDRGVAITRVFVYDQWSKGLDGLLREQQAAGVEVYTISKTQLDAELIKNLIIWDRDSAWEAMVNAEGRTVKHFFTVEKFDIEEMVRQFERITSRATLYAP
jgi:hypothetical protein